METSGRPSDLRSVSAIMSRLAAAACRVLDRDSRRLLIPASVDAEPGDVMQQVSFVWLEITGHCQLECRHCYAASGPAGTHGAMATDDWRRVIDEAAGLGADMVQFIGGEPTLYPALPGLITSALGAGVEVEVFSNLVHVAQALWEVFEQAGVRLATSYYTDDPVQHAAITGRTSHARTSANIRQAVRRSIPLRVGVIDLDDQQHTAQAIAELRDMGVTDVGTDRLRQVGRGIRDAGPGLEELCGHCADGVLAVAPSGDVWPCVFARWLPVGNVLTASLADIVGGQRLQNVRADLVSAFVGAQCRPRCGPSCHPSCNPACQ